MDEASALWLLSSFSCWLCFSAAWLWYRVKFVFFLLTALFCSVGHTRSYFTMLSETFLPTCDPYSFHSGLTARTQTSLVLYYLKDHLVLLQNLVQSWSFCSWLFLSLSSCCSVSWCSLTVYLWLKQKDWTSSLFFTGFSCCCFVGVSECLWLCLMWGLHKLHLRSVKWKMSKRITKAF